MKSNLIDLTKKRRSIYALGKNIDLTDEQIVDLMSELIENSPSAFNSQTGKIVVLFNGNHEDFWNIVENKLKEVMGPDRDFTETKAKMDMFKGAYGTILFFENTEKVKELQNAFPAYSDNFPIWSEHSSAIIQILAWIGLAEQNIGANVQHYNPIIDDEVKAKWNIPEEFELVAQMPFGEILSPAGDREADPINNRLKVFK